MKYLAIRLSSLGDVVLCLPALAAALRQRPEDQFHLLTSAPYADLCRCVAGLTVWTPEPQESLWACGRRLSQQSWTHVYDLQGGTRGLTLRMALTSPTTSLERYPLRRRWWVWTQTPPSQPLPLRIQAVADLWGGQILRPCLGLPDEIRQNIDHLLLGASRLVGLIPGSRWRNKRWPAEHFSRLAAGLIHQGYDVVWVGDEQERSTLQQMAGDLPGRICAERDLRLCAGVLARCERVVGGDTGLVHLAELMGVPVVTLFGPTLSGGGFGPSLPTSEFLERDLPCRPCHIHGGDHCVRGNQACMTGILPEEVMGVVMQHS